MIERWWSEAEAHQVLPLDDRFAERFAENAARVHGDRMHYEFWAGMGHLPTDVAPDLRSRSYRIVAEVEIPEAGADGVLIAHGDATSGYSLYLDDGHLVHDLNIGGSHQVVRSDRPVPPGRHDLAFRMARVDGTGTGTGTLEIDGVDVGSMTTARHVLHHDLVLRDSTSDSIGRVPSATTRLPMSSPARCAASWSTWSRIRTSTTKRPGRTQLAREPRPALRRRRRRPGDAGASRRPCPSRST